MLVTTKHGKNMKGYSLKDTNGAGIYYVYIWDKRIYDADHVKEKRKQSKEKGKDYGRAWGWKSLGRYDDPKTYAELRKHLQKVYKENFLETEYEIRAFFEAKHERQEQQRHEQLTKYRAELLALAEEKGVTLKAMPKTVSGLKKKIKTIKDK